MAASKPKKVALKATKEAAGADLVTDVLSGIRKDLGGEGALLLGDDAMLLRIRGVISTRCPALDLAIGRGGIPLGRLSILHGGEGSGKTTLALQTVAEVQGQDGLAVYIDREFKLDPDYAVKLGVDTKRLIISQPGTLEGIVEMIKGVITRVHAYRKRGGRRRPVLIVIDSLNACLTKAQIDGAVGDHHIAPQARVWSENLPKIIEACAKEDVALLFISQVRKKIGIMFGDDNDLAGGQAPRFYASLIMYVTRTGTEKVDGEKVGNKIQVECKKNQIAPPFKKAQFIVRYGRGVDFHRSLITVAEEAEILKRSGSYYSYQGERIGNSIEMAAKRLRKNAELAQKIHKEWREKAGWL